MVKIKPERIAGIVALTYLVLIPAGGIYLVKRVEKLEDNVEDLWTRIGDADPEGSWAKR